MLTINITRRHLFLLVLAFLMIVPLAAYAGSVFDDVDDTDTHIDGITFMKDSGVSVGCDANNNYCPEDNVTRAQMGTFMYRLSGNDPATDPSVNAATLEGAGAVAYTTQIDGMTCANAGGCNDPGDPLTVTNVMDMPVSFDADGVARLSYSAAIADTGSASPNFIQMWLALNDDSCGEWFFAPLDSIDGTFSAAQIGGDHDWAQMNGETVTMRRPVITRSPCVSSSPLAPLRASPMVTCPRSGRCLAAAHRH